MFRISVVTLVRAMLDATLEGGPREVPEQEHAGRGAVPQHPERDEVPGRQVRQIGGPAFVARSARLLECRSGQCEVLQIIVVVYLFPIKWYA